MYKVLVVSSTEKILQSKQEFEKVGFTFDFLIAEKDSVYNFGRLEDQFINVDHELIPFLEDEKLVNLTRSQQQKKKKSHLQMNQLKHILFQNLRRTTKNYIRHVALESQTKSSSKTFYFDDVVDLILNQKDKKIHLEVQHEGIRNYDHILIEESYLNFSLFAEKFKQQDFFISQAQHVFQFVGLKFKIDENIGQFKFWLMTDANYNSIYDNLYYISALSNVVDVWLWLPAQQLKNPTTLKYFSERALKHLSKKLDFLKFETIPEELSLQPINTYMVADCNCKNLITFIPHFHFSSAEQVAGTINYFSDIVIKKLRIKKEFIQKTQIEDSL